MSLKTQNSAVIILEHDPSMIRKILLDISNLSTWNPAFSNIGPEDSDGAHPVTVRSLLKGKLTYTQPSPDVITFHIEIPGLTEESTFTLIPDTRGTTVAHTINQHGVLTAIIGNHEASLVPHKRLTRLTQIVNNSSPHDIPS